MISRITAAPVGMFAIGVATLGFPASGAEPSKPGAWVNNLLAEDGGNILLESGGTILIS